MFAADYQLLLLFLGIFIAGISWKIVTGRVVYSTGFAEAVVVQAAFDQFVAEECENAVA